MNGVNTDELADFLDFTRDQELDVRFIEWMPFDDNRWKDDKFFSYQVIHFECLDEFRYENSVFINAWN